MFRSKIDKKDLKEFSKISFWLEEMMKNTIFILSRGDKFYRGSDILKNSKLEKIGKSSF